MEKQPKELLFLNDVHRRLLDLATALKFDGEHAWHSRLVTLYSSIVEIAYTVSRLSEDMLRSSIPTILRSMLEAQIDLMNLAADRKYGYTLDSIAIHNQLKLFRAIKKGTNPLLSGIKYTADVDKKIASAEAWQARNKDKVDKDCAKWVRARFAKAGLTAEYETIYSFLCLHSHNDALALDMRHMQKGEGEKKSEFFIFQEKPIDEIAHYFAMAAGILIKASVLIHKTLETKAIDAVNAIETEFTKFTEEQESRQTR